jgi:hypothetical protein
VLVLDYLRTTGQSQPEIEEKALAYLQEGYQGLTSYEVQGGGFSWFGDAPAHNVLTAYGLIQFVDMARVFTVDPALISRTAAWLAAQQQQDGSFTPTSGGIAEGAIDAYQRDTFRATAFLTWALARAGGQDAAVEQALNWLAQRAGSVTDSYALAVYVNALAAVDPQHAGLPSAVVALRELAEEGDGVVSFPGAAPSSLAPCGAAPTPQTTLEVTALAAHGLIVAQSGDDVVNRALTYLVRNKDSFGTWQSTQATIRSLQALLASVGASSPDAEGGVLVRMNGAVVGDFSITPQDASVMRVVDVSALATPGTHLLEIEQTGTGTFQYQVAGRTYGPRSVTGTPKVAVAQSFSTTTPALGETVTVTTTVQATASFEQLLVDVAIPPGFDLDATPMEALRAAGTVSRVEVEGTHMHVYVPALQIGVPLELDYLLRARLSARVTAPPVRAYAYYDPSMSGESAPVTLEVP